MGSFQSQTETAIKDEVLLSTAVRTSKMQKKKVRERQFSEAKEVIRDRITFSHINKLFENGFEIDEKDKNLKVNTKLQQKPSRHSELTHMKKFEGMDLKGINPMWEELAEKQAIADKAEANRPSWKIREDPTL